MNFIKKNIRIFIIAIILLTNTSQVLATGISDAFDTGGRLNTMAGSNGMGYKTEITSDILIGTIIKAFLSVLGIIFLVLMLYGGYLWMTDRGNNDSVKKAQNVIQAAVIGLAIVLISYSITYFVIDKLGSTTLQ